MNRFPVRTLILIFSTLALAANDVDLLSGRLQITNTSIVKVSDSGGESEIHLSHDGEKIYRVSLSNVYEVDYVRRHAVGVVFDSKSLPPGTWIERMSRDDENQGWFILTGNSKSNLGAAVYHVDTEFKNLRSEVNIKDIDIELANTPVSVSIFEKNLSSQITAMGYSSETGNAMVFYRVDTDGEVHILREDVFQNNIKSFAFSEEGSSAVALADSVAVFYSFHDDQVKMERIFSVPLMTRPQVLYSERNRAFVFVSDFDIHKISLKESQVVHVSERLLDPNGGSAFWGPIAISDRYGVLAIAQVFGAGFYDLDRGEANTFVKGQKGYEFFYGNFSAHSVEVARDGRTFLFNGLTEVGVVDVSYGTPVQ